MDESLMYESVAIVGNTLAPFFMFDPTDSRISTSYSLFAQDYDSIANMWPFGDKATVNQAFTTLGASLAEGIDQTLIDEYRRLFVGPHHLVVPPWGSVYTDYDGVTFGHTTIQLQQWLKKQGIAFKLESKEAIDHIGVMLSLMAYIAAEQPNIFSQFMNEHFLTWGHHYANLLLDCASQPFFQGLALLLQATLIGIEKDCLLSPSKIKLYR